MRKMVKMKINLNKVKQVLHVLTIIGFTISVFFQLKKLYLYGGSISTNINDDNDDDGDDAIKDTPQEVTEG